MARFINAPEPETVIFVKNATEAINLVAYSWARHNLTPDDDIVVSPIEHHSNLVPWQPWPRPPARGIRFFDITDDGRVRTDNLDDVITERTKLVAVTHASNVLGTIVPVREIARGPQAGRGGLGGRGPEHAAHARGRASFGLRLFRAVGP